MILTNAHVAGFGPVSLRLKFEGQEKFTSVERLFVDSKHDVAVIKIEPEKIPEGVKALGLDCSYELSVAIASFQLVIQKTKNLHRV